MGLDFRLWCKRFDADDGTAHEIDVCTGQGRAEFAFLRNWVGDDRYGEDIELTIADVDEIIAAEQSQAQVGEPVSCLLDHICYGELGSAYNTFNSTALVIKLHEIRDYLIAVKGKKIPNAAKFYIECDW